MFSVLVVCLFFFQAEDGIRDLYVTGVQTCALPIWIHPRHRKGRQPRADGRGRSRSEERRVGKSVDLGGRRIIKKKKKQRNRERTKYQTKLILQYTQCVTTRFH